MRSVRLLANGRVTIPKAVRDGLGWKPGDRFVVKDVPDGVMVEKVSASVPSSVNNSSSGLPKEPFEN